MVKKWITSVGLALCLLLVLLPVNAQAAESVTDQQWDNLTWSYDSDTKTLTISGTGDMPRENDNRYPYQYLKDEIEKVVIENGITSISDSAFLDVPSTSAEKNGYTALTSVTIPDSVISIGVYAFYDCISLTSINIPEDVTSIGEGAFYNCNKLTSINIPEGVTGIENLAFCGCSSLASIEFPEGVTSIGGHAFNGCSSLTSIKIPKGVTSIGGYAFSLCSNLTSIEIPEGVTSIGKGAFDSCTGLEKLYLPNSIKDFYANAFQYCGKLNDVYYDGPRTDYEKVNYFSDVNDETVQGNLEDVFNEGTVIHCKVNVTFAFNYVDAPDVPYDSKEVFEGEQVEKPTNPNRTGYDFDGWFKEETCTNEWKFDEDTVAEDTTLYAKWTRSYTVTFDLNYDDAPENTTIQVTNGDKVTKPTDPTRTGYTLVGWFKEKDCTTEWKFGENTVTEDITLYAKWTETYMVTFNLNYTDATGAPESQTVAKGGTATRPANNPTRTGHTFGGWFKEAACTNAWNFETDTITETTTIYAKWTGDTPSTPTTYTVTFSLNYTGATGAPVAQTISAGGKATKPTDPTRTGYTFAGWFKEATCTNAWNFETNTITGTTTIYAKWTEDTAKTYTITFDLNYTGSTDAPDAQTTGADGKLASLPSPPSREGYTFDGWFTAATSGTEVTTSTVFTEDAKVYARWTQTITTPSATRYRIYTPGSVPGGRYDVSRSSAAQGTLITIEVTPGRDYALDRLLVTNLETEASIPLVREYSDEYTFTMPAADVEIEISFVNPYAASTYFYTPSQAKPGPTAWYYRDRHIYHVTDGMVPDGAQITRDMFLSVLYNLTDGSLISVDSQGSETNAAQVWATSNGILPDIYASGLWGLDSALTREQTAMLVFNYARYRGYHTSQALSITHYSDYSRVRPIARTPMSWALAANLLDSATLSPQATLTCGQAGDLLYRFEATVAW